MEDMAACDERIFLVETPFVLTTPKRMDPQLLAKFRECLDANGVTYSGDEVNFNEFTAELSDSEFRNGDSSLSTCLVDSAFELYPDLISVGVGR